MNQPLSKFAAPKQPYDQFIGKLVANAVREIESQTGRQVKTLAFPTPSCFENKDSEKRITVQFADPGTE
jgi:hypothetical protein